MHCDPSDYSLSDRLLLGFVTVPRHQHVEVSIESFTSSSRMSKPMSVCMLQGMIHLRMSLLTDRQECLTVIGVFIGCVRVLPATEIGRVEDRSLLSRVPLQELQSIQLVGLGSYCLRLEANGARIL